MTMLSTPSTTQSMDVIDICRTIAANSPIPTAEIDPLAKTIICVNLAFCLLTGKCEKALSGTLVCLIVPGGAELAALLDHVMKTGESASGTMKGSDPSPLQWTYTLWPVLLRENRPPSCILQVTEATVEGEEAVLVNQALLFGALRQHELIEAAERLNTQLRGEMMARKAAERAFIQSERLATAGRMAAVLAHEINNPLSSIVDLLYLTSITEDVPLKALDYIGQADVELRRIAHVVRQTLGFCREPGPPTTFQVRPLLESIVDLLKAKVRSSRATVDLRCPEDLQVTGNFAELRQVLSNLLLNSLDAVGEKGRVVIRASHSRDPKTSASRLRFTVADNGRGINKSSLKQVFDAFYTTKGTTGNGLGLWVSKQIIDNYHGSLRVRSSTQSMRKGTTFSVTLPELTSGGSV